MTKTPVGVKSNIKATLAVCEESCNTARFAVQMLTVMCLVRCAISADFQTNLSHHLHFQKNMYFLNISITLKKT